MQDLFLHTWLKRGGPSENPLGAGQPARQGPALPGGPSAAAAAERGLARHSPGTRHLPRVS